MDFLFGGGLLKASLASHLHDTKNRCPKLPEDSSEKQHDRSMETGLDQVWVKSRTGLDRFSEFLQNFQNMFPRCCSCLSDSVYLCPFAVSVVVSVVGLFDLLLLSIDFVCFVLRAFCLFFNVCSLLCIEFLSFVLVFYSFFQVWAI